MEVVTCSVSHDVCAVLAGLRTVGDPVILQWAADEGRTLVSHDLKTVQDCAGKRLVPGCR